MPRVGVCYPEDAEEQQGERPEEGEQHDERQLLDCLTLHRELIILNRFGADKKFASDLTWLHKNGDYESADFLLFIIVE